MTYLNGLRDLPTEVLIKQIRSLEKDLETIEGLDDWEIQFTEALLNRCWKALFESRSKIV